MRVNAVAPGPVWTPLQPSGGQTPNKLLTSDEASFTTGQVFGATGGEPGP